MKNVSGFSLIELMRKSRVRQSAFTLIELIVGIAIMAILLTIAVPSFTSVINNNKTITTTNNLITALTLARSEALKRSTPVAVCPGTGSTCTNSTDWSAGLIVWVDDGATVGSIDTSENTSTHPLLQNWQSSNGVGVTSTGATYVRYLANGSPYNPGGLTTVASITIVKSGCTGKYKRTVTIANTGRVSTASSTCP